MNPTRITGALLTFVTTVSLSNAHAGRFQEWKTKRAARKLEDTMIKGNAPGASYKFGINSSLSLRGTHYGVRFDVKKRELRGLAISVETLAKHAEDAVGGQTSPEEKARLIATLRHALAPNVVSTGGKAQQLGQRYYKAYSRLSDAAKALGVNSVGADNRLLPLLAEPY